MHVSLDADTDCHPVMDEQKFTVGKKDRKKTSTVDG